MRGIFAGNGRSDVHQGPAGDGGSGLGVVLFNLQGGGNT